MLKAPRVTFPKIDPSEVHSSLTKHLSTKQRFYGERIESRILHQMTPEQWARFNQWKHMIGKQDLESSTVLSNHALAQWARSSYPRLWCQFCHSYPALMQPGDTAPLDKPTRSKRVFKATRVSCRRCKTSAGLVPAIDGWSISQRYHTVTEPEPPPPEPEIEPSEVYDISEPAVRVPRPRVRPRTM